MKRGWGKCKQQGRGHPDKNDEVCEESFNLRAFIGRVAYIHAINDVVQGGTTGSVDSRNRRCDWDKQSTICGQSSDI